jgi:hypothetical protein
LSEYGSALATYAPVSTVKTKVARVGSLGLGLTISGLGLILTAKTLLGNCAFCASNLHAELFVSYLFIPRGVRERGSSMVAELI